MIFQTDKIMQDVRACLDDNMKSDALLQTEDIDTLSLDDIIKSKIVEAVRRVHSNAPYYLLENGHNFGDALYWGDMESGFVLLPDDFMRLVVFEMDDWEQPVYVAISPDDPRYSLQHSRFKGIRGTAEKPVCAIVVRPEGKALEFYSCKSENAQVSQAVYMPYPSIDKDGGVDIAERCYDAVVYTAVALTFVTLGEDTRAKTLLDLASF